MSLFCTSPCSQRGVVMMMLALVVVLLALAATPTFAQGSCNAPPSTPPTGTRDAYGPIFAGASISYGASGACWSGGLMLSAGGGTTDDEFYFSQSVSGWTIVADSQTNTYRLSRSNEEPLNNVLPYIRYRMKTTSANTYMGAKKTVLVQYWKSVTVREKLFDFAIVIPLQFGAFVNNDNGCATGVPSNQVGRVFSQFMSSQTNNLNNLLLTIKAQPGDYWAFHDPNFRVGDYGVGFQNSTDGNVVTMSGGMPKNMVIVMGALTLVPNPAATSWNHTFEYNVKHTEITTAGYTGLTFAGYGVYPTAAPEWIPTSQDYPPITIPQDKNIVNGRIADHIQQFWSPFLAVVIAANPTPYQRDGVAESALVWNWYQDLVVKATLPTGSWDFDVVTTNRCVPGTETRTRTVVVAPTPFPALTQTATTPQPQCASSPTTTYPIFTTVGVSGTFVSWYTTKDVEFELRATSSPTDILSHATPGDNFANIDPRVTISGEYPAIRLQVDLTQSPNGFSIEDWKMMLNNITLSTNATEWASGTRHFTLQAVTPNAGVGGGVHHGERLRTSVVLDTPASGSPTVKQDVDLTIAIPSASVPTSPTSTQYTTTLDLSTYFNNAQLISTVSLTAMDGSAISDKVSFVLSTKVLSVAWHFPETATFQFKFIASPATTGGCSLPAEAVFTLKASRANVLIDVEDEAAESCAAISGATVDHVLPFATFTVLGGKAQTALLPGSSLLTTLYGIESGDVYGLTDDAYLVQENDFDLVSTNLNTTTLQLAITPKTGFTLTVARVETIARNIFFTRTTTPANAERIATIVVRTQDEDVPIPDPHRVQITFLTSADLPAPAAEVTIAPIVVSAAANDGTFSHALSVSSWFTDSAEVVSWGVASADGTAAPAGVTFDGTTLKLPVLSAGEHIYRIVATTSCGNTVFVQQKVVVYRLDIAQFQSSSLTDVAFCSVSKGSLFPNLAFATTTTTGAVELPGTSFVLRVLDEASGTLVFPTTTGLTVDSTTVPFEYTITSTTTLTAATALAFLHGIEFQDLTTTNATRRISIQSITSFTEVTADLSEVDVTLQLPIATNAATTDTTVYLPPSSNDGTFTAQLPIATYFTTTDGNPLTGVVLKDQAASDFTLSSTGLLSVLKVLSEDGAATSLVIEATDDCGNTAQQTIQLKVQVVATKIKDVAQTVSDLCRITTSTQHTIFPTFAVDLENDGALLRDVSFIITLSSAESTDSIVLATDYDAFANGLSTAYDAATGKLTIQAATPGAAVAKNKFEAAVKKLQFVSTATTAAFTTKTFAITTHTPESVDQPNVLTTTLSFLHSANLPARSGSQIELPVFLDQATGGSVHNVALSSYWTNVGGIAAIAVLDAQDQPTADLSWSAADAQITIAASTPRGVQSSFKLQATDKCGQNTTTPIITAVTEPTLVLNGIASEKNDLCFVNTTDKFVLFPNFSFGSLPTTAGGKLYKAGFTITLTNPTPTDVLSSAFELVPADNIKATYDVTTGAFAIAPIDTSAPVDAAKYEAVMKALTLSTTATEFTATTTPATRVINTAFSSQMASTQLTTRSTTLHFLTPALLPTPSANEPITIVVPLNQNDGTYSTMIDLDDFWSIAHRISAVELFNMDGTTATNVTFTTTITADTLTVSAVLDPNAPQKYKFVITDMCGREAEHELDVVLELPQDGNNSAFTPSSSITTLFAVVAVGLFFVLM